MARRPKRSYRSAANEAATRTKAPAGEEADEGDAAQEPADSCAWEAAGKGDHGASTRNEEVVRRDDAYFTNHALETGVRSALPRLDGRNLRFQLFNFRVDLVGSLAKSSGYPVVVERIGNAPAGFGLRAKLGSRVVGNHRESATHLSQRRRRVGLPDNADNALVRLMRPEPSRRREVLANPVDGDGNRHWPVGARRCDRSHRKSTETLRSFLLRTRGRGSHRLVDGGKRPIDLFAGGGGTCVEPVRPPRAPGRRRPEADRGPRLQRGAGAPLRPLASPLPVWRKLQSETSRRHDALNLALGDNALRAASAPGLCIKPHKVSAPP